MLPVLTSNHNANKLGVIILLDADPISPQPADLRPRVPNQLISGPELSWSNTFTVGPVPEIQSAFCVCPLTRGDQACMTPTTTERPTKTSTQGQQVK